MQIVSKEYNVHERLNQLFSGKYEKIAKCRQLKYLPSMLNVKLLEINDIDCHIKT